MVKVAVVGAAGYAGIELVRLVLGHPEFELSVATSGTDAGRRLSDVYPALAGATEAVFERPDVDSIAAQASLVFMAVPHTAAIAMAPDLMERGLTVVDLSADFRLKDAGTYEAWYGVEHTRPDLLIEAVYGLPELDRTRLKGARLVACPGCYPTATLLAALPALESGIALGPRIVVDAKSGVSGAGRTPSPITHYCSANESVTPYKVGAHRHTPEMEQSLSLAAGREVNVMFTPHLVPVTRGLLATVYLDVEKHFTTEEAHELYRGRYHAEPFVTVREPGEMASTSDVRGSNRASVGVHVDERTSTMIATCAIDNLVKGAAGQAIQCANAALGLPETTGLDTIPPIV